MSDEELTPGVDQELPQQDAASGDSQADSPSIADTQTQAINLTDLPDFKKWQAEADRDREAMRQQILAAQAAADAAQAQAEALQLTLSELEADPEDLKAANARAQALAESQAAKRRLAQLEHQVAHGNWEASWRRKVAENGGDPDDPRLAEAMQKAVTKPVNGIYDESYLFELVAEVKVENRGKAGSGTDERREAAQKEQDRAAGGAYKTIDERKSVPPGNEQEHAEIQKSYDALVKDDSMSAKEKTRAYMKIRNRANAVGYQLKVS